LVLPKKKKKKKTALNGQTDSIGDDGIIAAAAVAFSRSASEHEFGCSLCDLGLCTAVVS
jgi:hypothetical protein